MLDCPGIAMLTIAMGENSEASQVTVTGGLAQCFTIFSLYLANLVPGYPNVYNSDLLSAGAVAVLPWPPI